APRLGSTPVVNGSEPGSSLRVPVPRQISKGTPVMCVNAEMPVLPPPPWAASRPTSTAERACLVTAPAPLPPPPWLAEHPAVNAPWALSSAPALPPPPWLAEHPAVNVNEGRVTTPAMAPPWLATVGAAPVAATPSPDLPVGEMPAAPENESRFTPPERWLLM